VICDDVTLSRDLWWCHYCILFEFLCIVLVLNS